ncbi:hypothetical protein F5Y16DRAFT_357312 [Xylariaceae sp. FL0255]|nr:hypothetical protein F5Y16DRAFT_357312 [Xylariaceae sp. FL0255]
MAPRPLSLPSTLLRELNIQGSKSNSRHSRPPPSRKHQRKEARHQKKRNSRIRHTSHPTQIQHKSHSHSHSHSHDYDDDSNDDNNDDIDDLGDDHSQDLENDHDESESDKITHSDISKSTQNKLSQDDKEIAQLEKKLGLKHKAKLPKSFEDDGLGHLLAGLDDNDTPETSKNKRKSEADEWLAAKRRKAEALEHDDDDDDHHDDNSSFTGFSDSASDTSRPQEPKRENPYVAPATNVAKYVPPSLRNRAVTTDQAESQLQRRIQGLINRLTNDNMTGIVKDLTTLYQTNPRQTVSSSLARVLLMLVSSPEKRPDAFFVMVAAFLAALHKTMGVAVTAYFLQQQVEAIDAHNSDTTLKHLVALLAELYNMQVIGCNLMFDYVRLFLTTQSELNTELLLRIVQLSGPALRRDDPRALADIVDQLQSGRAKDVSVRTRFMMDEMKKLQSNKAKAVARNKDLADQRISLRKRINTLQGSHDAQPLRVGLRDIQEAETQGKWWLVGASWSGAKRQESADEGGDDDTEAAVDDDLGIPDLWRLAREQGFNTEVRQRIFVALHAATDCDTAQVLMQKLRLNKHQRREVAEVIVRSGERQNVYNPYYALVAGKLSTDKEMRFQLRRCLTTRFKRMGEEVDRGDGGDMGEEEEEEEGEEEESSDLRWLYNTAKLYGRLVAGGSLTLAEVFRYRNLAGLQERAQVFSEVLLVTMLQESKSRRLKDVVGAVAADMDVSRGLQHFLQEHIRETKLVDDKKARRTVRKRCDSALELLDSLVTKQVLEE